MAVSLLPYLKNTNVQDTVVRYLWDDWKTIDAIEEPDEHFVARLERLSQRAVLAFECGTAEWIVYRFGALDKDPAPWQFLDGAWAMTISPRYCGYGKGPGWQSFSEKGWDGPIRRPIKNALDGLETDIRQLASEYHTDPSFGAGVLTSLASYIMTDPLPFITWRDEVLRRLESLYLRQGSDPLGDPVPQQALNPSSEFEVGETEGLLNKFLSSLDFRTNPFLSTPEGMLEHFEGDPDFVGTPYSFDLQQDRQARRMRIKGAP
jgi:hypothetical protein